MGRRNAISSKKGNVVDTREHPNDGGQGKGPPEMMLMVRW